MKKKQIELKSFGCMDRPYGLRIYISFNGRIIGKPVKSYDYFMGKWSQETTLLEFFQQNLPALAAIFHDAAYQIGFNHGYGLGHETGMRKGMAFGFEAAGGQLIIGDDNGATDRHGNESEISSEIGNNGA